MAFVLKDRVQETCNSPGTGTITLLGAAIGYQTFSAAIGNGNTTYYAIVDQGGSNWEIGYGTYSSAGNTLARTTVLSSSNGGSLVNFSSGVQNVWVDYPAPKAVWLDINGDISQAIRNISGITGAITSPESITFDTNPAIIPTATGSIFWNAGNKSPSVILDADVSLQLGQENVALVYNGTGSTITNGSVVAVNGAQGQRPSVALADADSEALSAPTLGIATEDIANGAKGFVTTFGFVRNINTAAFTAGLPIYLSQTAGQFTQTRPAAPAHTVALGWVIKVNASSGEVFVNINNGWELDELHNVLITSPTGGQLLAYDQTNAYWKNINLGAGTGFAATAGTGGTLSIGASVAAVGTWMGTPSSANLLAAMTDETGSGLLVFNNTPTFISPLLGTPTSGTLTNCTGLPNAGLVNSSVTYNGVTVALGASGTITAASPNALTIGTGLSGTSYNGSAAVTIANTGVLSFSGGTTGLTPSTATTGAVTLAGTLAIANGGTGATTRQDAMDALAGATTSGQYLRGNGTDVVMSAIQAADVPTLNQNTTGTASNVTGVVAAANGGTGQSSYTIGDLLFASGTTALSKLADVATGNALISGGVGVAPSWGKIGLTTHISGTLAVGNGGTGLTSLTAGYIPYGNGTGALSTSANLTFSGSNLTVGGTVSAGNGASGGFYTSTFATNVSNNIWAFGNAVNYGLKYFQGTAGTPVNGGTSDTIAFPFGQTTAETSFFQFVGNGSNLSALLMTKQPMFRAALTNNGDQTYTNSVLPFNVSVIDKSGNFNTSTYAFTAPIAGTYCFYVQTYGTNSGGAATMANQMQVNGTSVSPSNGDTNFGSAGGQIGIAPIQSMMTINLAAGDTVRVFASAYNDAAVYRIFTGNSIFTGWLIG